MCIYTIYSIYTFLCCICFMFLYEKNMIVVFICCSFICCFYAMHNNQLTLPICITNSNNVHNFEHFFFL